jgi:hypothetical protein
MIKALAEVSSVNKNSDYRDGYTKPKVDYTESTLKILNNSQGIKGEIKIEKELKFGNLYYIIFDIDDIVSVVNTAVSDCEQAVDNVISKDSKDEKNYTRKVLKG